MAGTFLRPGERAGRARRRRLRYLRELGALLLGAGALGLIWALGLAHPALVAAGAAGLALRQGFRLGKEQS